MKLSLVVAQGVHTGKIIPVTTSDFVIGRDPQCQLRPASPAVSKQHCGISIKGEKVFIRDCGSTNGTFLNGEQVAGEQEAKSGDRIRVGPLEFDLRFEAGAPAVVAKPAAAAAGKVAAKPAPAAAKKKLVGVGGGVPESVPDGGTVEMSPNAQADDDSRASSTTIVDAPGSGLEDDADHAAAMLLGMDDGPMAQPTIEQLSADATTLMEVPALGAKPGEPKKEEKKTITDSSSAAADALSKYMRRPRT